MLWVGAQTVCGPGRTGLPGGVWEPGSQAPATCPRPLTTSPQDRWGGTRLQPCHTEARTWEGLSLGHEASLSPPRALGRCTCILVVKSLRLEQHRALSGDRVGDWGRGELPGPSSGPRPWGHAATAPRPSRPAQMPPTPGPALPVLWRAILPNRGEEPGARKGGLMVHTHGLRQRV